MSKIIRTVFGLGIPLVLAMFFTLEEKFIEASLWVIIFQLEIIYQWVRYDKTGQPLIDTAQKNQPNKLKKVDLDEMLAKMPEDSEPNHTDKSLYRQGRNDLIYDIVETYGELYAEDKN